MPPAAGHFTGLIDEVRLWSVARTQAEIQQARSVLLAPSTAGLVGYWQFEEADGEIVHDSTSNQYAGALGADASAGSDDPLRDADVPFN